MGAPATKKQSFQLPEVLWLQPILIPADSFVAFAAQMDQDLAELRRFESQFGPKRCANPRRPRRQPK